MKTNVLVFPCGSEIGLEIHKAAGMSTSITLYGGSSVSDHGEYVYENYIDGLPNVDDEDFVERINAVISKYDIEFVFPAHDSVVLKLAQAFEEGLLACSVLTSPKQTCEVARSKAKSYEIFDGIIKVPKSHHNLHNITVEDFPLFLKPDVGQGSKGVFKAAIIEEVLFYTKKDPSLLVLEYLPGKEYTIDCFTNKAGELLFSEARERSRTSNGISMRSETVVNQQPFADIAKSINETLPFRGAWFFQVKEDKNGILTLLEIAPRIAGTMGLVRSKGVNLPLMTIFDALGFEVEVIENDHTVTIDRALYNSYKHDMKYKYVYLDFDDTVVIDNKVNLQVIAFVYQCINKNIPICLITKHAEDIYNTLSIYRLTDVFQNVLHIEKEDEKADYIIEKNAIFIDDSYSERKKVHDQHRIPVFDTHSIESLIEKF